MKISRQKKSKRILNFFRMNYNVKPPYNVLLCGTFVVNCISEKVNIRDQLPKYLAAETNFYTTSCCIQELEDLSNVNPEKVLTGSCHVLKQFQLRRCGHEKERKAGSKCLKAMLKADNPQK